MQARLHKKRLDYIIFTGGVTFLHADNVQYDIIFSLEIMNNDVAD